MFVVKINMMGRQFYALLTISARAMGKRKPLVPDWQIPWAPDDGG